MEKMVIEMLEAYIRGSLELKGVYTSDYMQGYFAGIQAVGKHLQFEKEVYGLIPSNDETIKVEA